MRKITWIYGTCGMILMNALPGGKLKQSNVPCHEAKQTFVAIIDDLVLPFARYCTCHNTQWSNLVGTSWKLVCCWLGQIRGNPEY